MVVQSKQDKTPMSTLVFDIETDGLEPTVIHQLSIKEYGSDSETVESYYGDGLSDGYQRLRGASRLVAHNGIAYDVPAIAAICGIHLDYSRVVDTLVLSRLGNPERPGGHSLASWGESLGFPKVAHEDWTAWSPEMEHRCNMDVELTCKVFEKLEPMLELMPEACAIEHKVARVIDVMSKRGVQFDTDAARELLNTLMGEQENLEASVELPWRYFRDGPVKKYKKPPNKRNRFHGIVDADVEFQPLEYRQLRLGSRPDVARYLIEEHGWKPSQKTETGLPKVNDDILRGLPWPEAQPIADYYRTVKLIGYLNSEITKAGNGGGWLHHVTPKGRLHARFIPLRAVTGRPSCVAPNLQQVSSDPRARALFGPRPRWSLVGVDADGQELRCLGHYLHRYDGGAYAREVVEGDIHSRVQQMIGFETRNGTKPVEYGLIYGAGDEKLGLIALQDAMSVGKTIKGSLTKRGKEIRKCIMDGLDGFEALMKDVRLAASQRKRLRGLDGRPLWVRSPHSALNLLLQSAGIIHMKKAISIVDDRLQAEGLVEDEDYGLVLWVHDELQFECRPEVAELVGKVAAKAIEDAAEMLGFRVPMSGTYQVGNNWSETH